MRMIAALILGLGLIGCPARPPAKPAEKSPVVDAKAERLAKCQAECERDRQMQAISQEAIAAGCRSDCERAEAE